jgi:hypothetical protein
MRINGKIHYKYIAVDNHAARTIVLSENGKHNRYKMPFDLYEHASIGDSIFKDSGSLKYCLLKQDTTICYYPKCNGKELRD